MLLNFIILTANILGIFNDPFEFQGDYGSEMNPTRERVFELLVSKEALAKTLIDSQIQNLGKDPKTSRDFLILQGRREDLEHGPTLSQLIPSALIKKLEKKQKELQDSRFSSQDLKSIKKFIRKYKNTRLFYFLKNSPSSLLSLDSVLKREAARKGKIFDLPIIGSLGLLEGSNDFELKQNLMEALFTKEDLDLTHPPDSIRQSLNNRELDIFSSPGGQLFFYWMYQTLNLHIISENGLIEEVNKVKMSFARTIGDPASRAQAFKEKVIHSNCRILFTQEGDTLTSASLTHDGLFLPVDGQNDKDGTFIFLKADDWEPEYDLISIKDYEETGTMNAIIATRKNSGQKFLLASCHGCSTKPEDGRRQVTLVMQKFHELSLDGLQVVIGIDANTKSEEDIKNFHEHLASLGLVATNIGPTTVKRRMVTVQHSKVGRIAIDQEDYLVILKPERGGKFQFSHMTVGFKEELPDINRFLPNADNPSDHYPVGASLREIRSDFTTKSE